MASAISVEKCCLAVGEVVGHENILSASKMNNAIVIFLSTVERANELVEAGIVVDELFTPVLPLSTPSKKVTLSSVPPFLSDEIFAKALSRYGKLVSPVKKIPISSELPLLKHVVSFRSFVYMIMNDDADLDVSLHFQADEYDYIIYVTTEKMKCFNCGQSGHLIRACPAKISNKPSAGGDIGAGKSDVVVNAVPGEAVLSDETPGVSGLQAVEDKNEEDLPLITVTAAKKLVPENTLSGVEMLNAFAKAAVTETVRHLNKAFDNNLQSTEMGICDDTLMETDQTGFKVLLKRKKPGKASIVRHAKKVDITELSDKDEMESDSESSDSSVSLSQSDFSGCHYEVDDIKLFLRATKNKRGVRINEY